MGFGSGYSTYTHQLQLESWIGNGDDRESKPMDSTGWKHMLQESFGDGSRCQTPTGMEINASQLSRDVKEM